MTEIEFKQYLKEFREYRWTEDEMVQKAKQLSSASNGAKPIVSGAVCDGCKFDKKCNLQDQGFFKEICRYFEQTDR